MDKIIDYNKKIREVGKLIYDIEIDYLSTVYGYVNKYEFLSKNAFLKIACSADEKLIDLLQIKEFAELYAILTMVKYQLYIDYYKKLNLKESLGVISEKEADHLEKLRNNSSFEKVIELTKDNESEIPYKMVDAFFDFSKTSIYEKVLQIKALNDDDIKTLTNINPFFLIEKNKYDIDISLSFIKDRINKLNGGIFKENQDRTYDETVNFIFDLNQVRKEEATSLLDEIMVESGDIDMKPDFDSCEDIKCSYGYISKDKLKSLLMGITKTDDVPVKKKK